MKFDLAVVGGGVIGLSIAFEALSRGWSVVVIEKPQIQPQTSWAGAGILPATNAETAVDPFDRLRALSDQLHPQWSQRLKELSEIDNQLLRCGTLFVANSPGEVASLRGQEHGWLDEKIEFQICSREQINSMLSGSNPETREGILRAVFVPGEHQIRNPDHLAALEQSCLKLGGQIAHAADVKLTHDSNLLTRLNVDNSEFAADRFCFAGGAWTAELLTDIGVEIDMEPVRGQMLLFKLDDPLFKPTMYEGSQYIVSRNDGHVLVGSTLERAGFDNSNTEEAVERLRKFALKWSSRLDDAAFVQSWAGLRPGTHDGMPYIGQLTEFQNAFVATGHLRSGLHLSTGTAVVLNQMMRGETTDVDLEPFRPSRG